MSEKKIKKGSEEEGARPVGPEEEPSLKNVAPEGSEEDGAASARNGNPGEAPSGGGEDSSAKQTEEPGVREEEPSSADEGSEPSESSGTDDGDSTEEGADEKEQSDSREDESQRYMRLAADFQNFKKRTEKEKADIYAYANEKFAADLLEVLDNFERAIAQENVEGADAKFLEGMDMILTQLKNVLARNDVEEIAAIGEEFDPNVHHAVMMEPSDTWESGKVTDVMQKGYRLKDKVVRPAMVKVAQ